MREDTLERFKGRMMLPVDEDGGPSAARAFDPKRPKLDVDDIRERIRGHYIVYMPQLRLLMDAYDSVLRIAPSGLRKKLVGDLENRANQIAVEGWDSGANARWLENARP